MNPVELMVQYMMQVIMVRFLCNDFAHAIGIYGQGNTINIVNVPKLPKAESRVNSQSNGIGIISTNGYKNGTVNLSSLITTRSMLDASLGPWSAKIDEALALARSAL